MLVPASGCGDGSSRRGGGGQALTAPRPTLPADGLEVEAPVTAEEEQQEQEPFKGADEEEEEGAEEEGAEEEGAEEEAPAAPGARSLRCGAGCGAWGSAPARARHGRVG